MKFRNSGDSMILLGAVHNGQYTADTIRIEPMQIIDLDANRLKCYDPDDLKRQGLVQLGAVVAAPVPAPAPAAPAAAPQPDPEQKETNDLIALLKDANAKPQG